MNRHVNAQESLKSESVSTYSSDQPTILPTLGHVSHTVAFIRKVVYLRMALSRSIFMDGLTPASRMLLGTVVGDSRRSQDWRVPGMRRHMIGALISRALQVIAYSNLFLGIGNVVFGNRSIRLTRVGFLEELSEWEEWVIQCVVK
ncbi:hypothetical protein NPIL_423961 [Nephila pilipes]|uniref:Uncharacterized protein n=1 Tax=Nephila pilipes TaxID=299642 RepID=A0A8X6TX81_NEPPI|nr:hypothetical protein NPIL_423961 [Nephila pilipes]